MTHTIINQNKKHLIEPEIRQEIIFMLEYELTHCYYMGQKIEFVSDEIKDKERVTVVRC